MVHRVVSPEILDWRAGATGITVALARLADAKHHEIMTLCPIAISEHRILSRRSAARPNLRLASKRLTRGHAQETMSRGSHNQGDTAW